MNRMTKEQEKKYKTVGWTTLVLSFGIYFAGVSVDGVFHPERWQYTIALLVAAVLSFVNVIMAAIIAYRLRGKSNVPALAAVIFSLLATAFLVFGATFVGMYG